MPLDRTHILNELLSMISDISDRAYQERIWIKGLGPEWDSFDDTVCDFFNIEDPMLEDYKAFNITEEQYQILKKFRDKFDLFCDKNDFPHEFIDTPEWAEIMKMAKEVLKAFHYTSSKAP